MALLGSLIGLYLVGKVVRKLKEKRFLTSFDAGHRHAWSRKNKTTSFNNGHRHRISLGKRLALPARRGGHTHRLLNSKI